MRSISLKSIAFCFTTLIASNFPCSALADTEAVPDITTMQITGCFSEDGESLSANSICLFADGSFYYPMLLNITGSYELTGNKLRFFPDQNEIFEVYARHDPTLKNATHFNFTGFNLDSLIDFDDTGFNYIPLEFSSCLWQPKVESYTHQKSVQRFSLAYSPHDGQAVQTMMVYSYEADDKLNDFLLIHNRPNISQKSAVVLSDGQANGEVWLQMGKNTLSMSRIPMITKDVYNLQKIGHKVAKSTHHFPKMIDQNNNITMQNPNGYFVDKNTNLMYPDPKQAHLRSKGWQAYIKKEEANGNTPYLKVYHKLNVKMQTMQEAIIEQRPDNPVSNCL